MKFIRWEIFLAIHDIVSLNGAIDNIYLLASWLT